MALAARGHVEGLVMVFCDTCWLHRVCGEIYHNHSGIWQLLGYSIECFSDLVLQEHE